VLQPSQVRGGALQKMGLRRALSGLAGGAVRASEQSRGIKVAVLGAAGGIGQPTSLLLKMNPHVSELKLYDLQGTEGVATDISHINTAAAVSAFNGEESLPDAVKDVDLVSIPAGMPRKPGMTRDDLFVANAGIVAKLITAIGTHSPSAIINMITNPVNSTVPVASKILQNMGVYDHTKLFGVTTLDVVRAKTFVAQEKGLDPSQVNVPVVGGHAGQTILPLFSQAKTPTGSFSLDAEAQDRLTKRVQEGGTEVVNAKGGAGSATLSMAYAGAMFADSCLRAMKGESGVYECAYVQSHATNLDFFASRVSLGRSGIHKVFDIDQMDNYEKNALQGTKEELSNSIDRGYKYVRYELPARRSLLYNKPFFLLHAHLDDTSRFAGTRCQPTRKIDIVSVVSKEALLGIASQLFALRVLHMSLLLQKIMSAL
jgi:malate dehydrogenase